MLTSSNSNIRQVPDNQEVYLDINGCTSVIFDITERVAVPEASTDAEALKYHYRDIVDAQYGGDDEETKFWHSATVQLTKMPDVPCYYMFASQHPRGAQQLPPRAPNFTGIVLILVRLVDKKTDVLILINVPHIEGEYSKDDIDLPAQKIGPLLEKAESFKRKILETFEVKDWNLFVEE